ncbi:MAG: hypothetical protein AAFQ80_12640 [Cyanobacteria bacterium J06621_8]
MYFLIMRSPARITESISQTLSSVLATANNAIAFFASLSII